MSNKFYNKSQQQGAVLLIFALILLLGSTYSLIKKLNTETNYYLRQSNETQKSLSLAKQALMGYAVTYPDTVNSDFGPGYLPCPDRDNDGDTDAGQCSSGGNTTIGRFPFETLEMSELRDGSGARLWYALSDNFRNSPKLEPLNSETEGQLSVDGNNDIVAVIIAPGAPIGNQSRDPADTNILTEISNYLETENNDLDLDFISIDPSATDFTDFNDRVISITRQELMAVIEKRVLGEVKLVLETYKASHGAYPWLSPFADPKAVARKLTGTADAGSGSTVLNANDNNFVTRGVAIGDVVYNLTDGSIGAVSSVAANVLGITGLALGTDNDFDVDDEYVVMPAATPTVLSGTATSTGDNDTLNDNSRNLNNIGIAIGDIVDNISDGSSAIIKSISTNSIEVNGLSGGADNLFQLNNIYQIRSNYGSATATAATQLIDANKNFIAMGVQAGELIQNITDGSIGRITAITATTLTVDSLLFGTNNQFINGDNYSLPRFSSTSGIREGVLGMHEVGEPFKTALNFDWFFTANATDIVVTNSSILPNYMTNYVISGSESFDDTVGTCIWIIPEIVDCFASLKDFVNISGNLTSGSNTDVITDSAALFNTNLVKRGDIAQNYDDETLVVSGTVDAGNSGTITGAPTTLTLQDTNNDFLNVNITVGDTVFNTTDGSSGIVDSVTATQVTVTSLSGGSDNIFEAGDDYQIGTEPTMYDASADFSIYERYSYLVQNQTLEAELGVGKIQAILADKEGVDTLVAESYIGESSTPIEFRPGDSYRIYQPQQFVIESVASETQLTADNYTSGTNPDFDNGEYYRVMPAANSQTARVDNKFEAGGIAYLDDASATFVDDGVELGDIVENDVGAFGEITFLTNTRIGATLYGPAQLDFWWGAPYTVYYDYVYSREHLFHAKFKGNQATKTITGERVRDVCLGYSAGCSTVSTAVNFSGNAGIPLISITDYQEDETTVVGTAAFTPTALSSGNLRVSNIELYLNEINDAIPDWFINNDWHKLIYVAYSAADAPVVVGACPGANCLTINGLDNNTGLPKVNSNNNNALVIAAGMEINTTLDNNCVDLAPVFVPQNRANGDINEYYESENCDASDDNFQEQFTTNTFNDQVRVVEP